MRKFMKWCAIIALILLLLGLAMAVVAGSMEGTAKVNELVESVTGGRVHLNLEPSSNWGITIGEDDWMNTGVLYDIDENMIFDNDYDVFKGDVEKFALGNNVKNLDIEAGGCAFYFKTSDDDNFYVEAKETGKFQCYVKNDTLYVKTTRTVSDWDDYDDCEIILSIPGDCKFEEVDVELGAGLLEMADVAAKEMDLEVGAGQIKADYMQADTCDIEVGMGEIIVEDMQVTKVNAEVGMGHLQLDGTILGDVSAECSMGAIEMNLTGSAEEFNYTVEAAMGNVTIDGESYSGLSQDQVIKNSADKNMNVECAMGDIQVMFEE